MAKVEFTFDKCRKIMFELSIDDLKCWWAEHKLKMVEWNGPLFMDALSGVNWDEVQKGFPYYTLKCGTCDKTLNSYNKDGTPK